MKHKKQSTTFLSKEQFSVLIQFVNSAKKLNDYSDLWEEMLAYFDFDQVSDILSFFRYSSEEQNVPKIVIVSDRLKEAGIRHLSYYDLFGNQICCLEPKNIKVNNDFVDGFNVSFLEDHWEKEFFFSDLKEAIAAAEKRLRKIGYVIYQPKEENVQ